MLWSSQALPPPKPSFLSNTKYFMKGPGIFWMEVVVCWRSCRCSVSLWAAWGLDAYQCSSSAPSWAGRAGSLVYPTGQTDPNPPGYSVTNLRVFAIGWIKMITSGSSLNKYVCFADILRVWVCPKVAPSYQAPVQTALQTLIPDSHCVQDLQRTMRITRR